MQAIERLVLRLRHHPLLRRADWLWDSLRPTYDKVITQLSQRGLSRCINGTDPVRLLPRFRQMSEQYEPEVWAAMMGVLRPGDVVADIGAFIGLYTLAIAQRVGANGRVVAFEPNPESYALLRSHLELNTLTDRVELHQLAVGSEEGVVALTVNRETMAAITQQADRSTVSVRCVRLDAVWGDRPLDVLKIDVEGYEEQVLRGATRLLSRQERPRVIFIEVHPYAWEASGTSSESLLLLLVEHGYRVTLLDGRPVSAIDFYGEIVAHAG